MDAVLTTARRGHPGLYAFAVAMLALSAALLVALAVDDRTLLGAPLWLKPLKFSISFTAYAGTLAWLLGQLPAPALRRSGWVIVAAGAIEMVIIVGQAARGVRSHFNDDTAADGLLFSIMGMTIVVLWLATLAVALRFLREPGPDPAARAAVRWGLVIALLAMAEGFLMAASGAHAVGVVDGGPGLPLVGWSTTGGDLRVAHFVGLHALQILPLLAAALARRGTGLDGPTRARLVTVAGAALTGLVGLLTWQALRGQPLLAPDAATLAALALLAAAAGAGIVAALRRSALPAGMSR